MSTESIPPSQIDWTENMGKRLGDEASYRAMAYDLMKRYETTGKTLRILSFPADTWAWELRLDEKFRGFPMQFIGLERDHKVFNRTRKFANGFPKRYVMPSHPYSFVEYAGCQKLRRKFDLIYLDWMGTWSKDKKEDIKALFQHRLLEVGGLLMFTVSVGRGHPSTINELYDYSASLPLAFYDARGSDRYVSNIKVRGIPGWIQAYAENEYEVGLQPIMANVYYSQRDGSSHVNPQLQIMMLRNS